MPVTLTPRRAQQIASQVETRSNDSRFPWRVSREEYHRLADLGFFQDMRVERIRGEIFVMSAMNWKHAVALSNIGEVIAALFGSGYFLLGQSPLPTADSDPEPDVTVVKGNRRDYDDHPTQRELVIEVADSSLAFDTGRKAELYASTGVLDYWVADLVHRKIIVFRDPQSDIKSEFGFSYKSRRDYLPRTSIVPLAVPGGRSIAVKKLLP